MRRWTQKVKLVVSERIEPVLRKTMQDECGRAGKPFDLAADGELRAEYDARMTEQFDADL